MAYNALPTVATGDPWSAANANTFWRDNFAYLKAAADAAAATIASALYPVGSIYITTVATNPATVLGFGTWAAFGAGQVLVGNGTSDATYSAGNTGGESTHTLTTPEIPAHTHTYHEMANPSARWSNGSGDYGAKYNDPLNTPQTASAGGGGAHNNMPPYVVVYFWKRTA